MIRNERGLITTDFLFAMVLIMGLSAMLFVLTFTLSLASLTQYITFASARNYVVAHLDQETQTARAVAKYKELISHPVFKPLYSNGWFKVDAEPNVGDHAEIRPEFNEAANPSNQFWGVGTSFTAAVLEFRIPFFGSTQPDGDGSGEGFKAYLGSYLGREPSADECHQFTAARWNAIRSLTASYGSGTDTSGYFPQTDDGC